VILRSDSIDRLDRSKNAFGLIDAASTWFASKPLPAAIRLHRPATARAWSARVWCIHVPHVSWSTLVAAGFDGCWNQVTSFPNSPPAPSTPRSPSPAQQPPRRTRQPQSWTGVDQHPPWLEASLIAGAHRATRLGTTSSSSCAPRAAARRPSHLKGVRRSASGSTPESPPHRLSFTGVESAGAPPAPPPPPVAMRCRTSLRSKANSCIAACNPATHGPPSRLEAAILGRWA